MVIDLYGKSSAMCYCAVIKSTGKENHMPTIANMPGADLPVTFPSGKVLTVNMLRLLVQTQNAEMKRDHGMFLPGVARLRPTVKDLRETYELDYFFDGPVRTWDDCAAVMRHFYNVCNDHMESAR